MSNGLKGLKSGKRDCSADITTDHIINCSDKFKVHLALLFTIMLRHGFTPHQFLCSTMLPIPKNKKKSLNDSSNYRAIAVSNVLGKLFDIIVMAKNKRFLSTSDMQFGFKKQSSTMVCTAVFDEAVKYYNNKGSNVYVLLLDASKAFDRVNHLKLFNLLLTKGLCPLLLKLLFNIYTNQEMNIQWNSCKSRYFSASNGVKQGGILSPVLFSLYIDILLRKLQLSGFGCHIGNTFCGALSYADDIALLAPTRFALKKLLSICEIFTKEYDILFNPEKSNFMLFSANKSNCSETINIFGKKLSSSDNCIHLGNVIGKNCDIRRIDHAVKDFNKKSNVMLSNFKNVSNMNKYKMFCSVSMALYGSQLWDYSAKNVQLFYTAWRKMIRRIFNLPNRTHCALLPVIAQSHPVDIQMHRRSLNFFLMLYNSNNSLVKMCSELAMGGSGTALCNSIKFFQWRYRIDNHILRSAGVKSKSIINFSFSEYEPLLPTATFVWEIINRDCNFLEPDNYLDILQHVCC